MKVILLERVGRLGTIGDEVSVKDGYGRNFLLPQGKAIRANEANRARFEKERAAIEKRNEERRNQAAGIAEGLNGAWVVVIRQASEAGTLYGSVSSRDIAAGLAEKGFDVSHNTIVLPMPIKTVGVHEISVELHAEVQVLINVNVARSENEADRQEAGEDMSVAGFDDEDNQDREIEQEGAEVSDADSDDGTVPGEVAGDAEPAEEKTKEAE